MVPLWQFSEAADHPHLIDGLQLVRDHIANLAAEPARDPEGVGVTPGGHWSCEKGSQVFVELVRRHDDTWPRLPDLGAANGVQ